MSFSFRTLLNTLLNRLLELNEAFEHIQEKVVNEGIRIIKSFEAVKDGDKIDFASNMSHADMAALCNAKTGFIIWLTDDFELQPKVIFPEEGAKGATDIAKVANFLLHEVDDILGKNTNLDATYTRSYFFNFDKALLPSEVSFMEEHWKHPKLVLKWRR